MKTTGNITIKKQMGLIRISKIQPRIIESRKNVYLNQRHSCELGREPPSYKEYYLLAESTITQ